ncbi:MAG: UDP-3-O-(3-hydroxymyristoyl)glucosamine N-acyltransferase [Alphaproteobacteria bacterium]|nr:UDP-3-O-(3-hydroxymyristoyl)glucosamine N-acyltransferase [Alphaproteobacteria bacterium]
MLDTRFFDKIKKIKASELAKICGFGINGNTDVEISGVATLKSATKNDLSFFGNKKYLEDLRNTSSGAVIVTEKDVSNVPVGVVALIFSNATLGYAKALEILYPKQKYSSYIATTAVIHETAKIGKGCYIGDYSVIGENVEIGTNCFIGNHTVIERGCKIGAYGYIHNNVTISHSIIGDHVIINSGARLGESGFGIIPTGESMMYIPQLGRVVVGNRVRIGSNTTIDRGSIEDTTIGNDTIIDNLVQIAHNVTIGNMTIIVSQVGIAGSTKIGNGVVLAGQVGVSGHIEIGDGAIAAAKCGIASSVKPGQIVGGIPAVDADIWRRQAAFLKSAVTKKKK